MDLPCRCCLARLPDKDLKSAYTRFGKTEIYDDMLKECFNIHLKIDTISGDNGICEICVTRLRDACNFRDQVLLCQKDLKSMMGNVTKSDVSAPLDNVKEELSDTEFVNGDYSEPVTDCETDKEEAREDEDDKSIAEILGLNGVIANQQEKQLNSTELLKKEKKRLKNTIKVSRKSLNPFATPSKAYHPKKVKHNLDMLLKYSNCTPFFNRTLTGVVCAYCKVTFPNIDELRSHTKSNHEGEVFTRRMDKNNYSVKVDISQLTCILCFEQFTLISKLKAHLIKEHKVKFYSNVHDYIMEFRITTDSPILNCVLCNSTFETFKMLLQHMNGHYRNYICDVCDLGFINMHRLKNHQRTHEIGTFKCDFCEKVFSTRDRKMCHEKYTHNSGARYTTNCPHCDQSFTSYYQRNRHLVKDHKITTPMYKCNICEGKSFILKSKLTSHIKKVHLMERNHICPECGQGFFIKQSLDEHMIKHNGARVFECTVCHKAYARKKTLREHMRIHNNDRRFKCGMCGLAFVQKCSLKSHMLSNHGISLSEYENMKKE